jgi:protease II
VQRAGRHQIRCESCLFEHLNPVYVNRQHAAAAGADDMGAAFHQIVDIKLNKQQDKAAILVNDGKHPDAFACVIRPIGMAVCYSGVMASGGAAFESLEAVHSVQWMLEGQHLVYTRVGASGVPAEVWLHHVGQLEEQDRQLYEEVRRVDCAWCEIV